MPLDALAHHGLRPKNTEFSFLFFIGLVWLLACQITFFFIQDNQGVELSHTVQAQFRSDIFRSDYEYLARAASDLESFSTIRCPTIEETEPVKQKIIDLTFRGGCVKHPWLLDGGNFEVIASAHNGDRYLVKFATQSGTGFILGLWGMRLGGLALLLLLYLFLSARRLQASRLQTLRLESAEQLNTLAKQVAHDIRSPLTALRTATMSLTSADSNALSLIQSATTRIDDIANDLLKRRTIEQQSAVAGAVTKLEPLLESILKEKRMEFASRAQIEFRADFDLSNVNLVAIPESDLARIISNLLNNAVESIENAGNISVATRNNKQMISVSITDSGKGIPKEHLARIGEKGFSTAKSGSKSGSGLGVFHARQVIEKFGGELSIQSKEGMGTIVTLKLRQ